MGHNPIMDNDRIRQIRAAAIEAARTNPAGAWFDFTGRLSNDDYREIAQGRNLALQACQCYSSRHLMTNFLASLGPPGLGPAIIPPLEEIPPMPQVIEPPVKPPPKPKTPARPRPVARPKQKPKPEPKALETSPKPEPVKETPKSVPAPAPRPEPTPRIPAAPPMLPPPLISLTDHSPRRCSIDRWPEGLELGPVAVTEILRASATNTAETIGASLGLRPEGVAAVQLLFHREIEELIGMPSEQLRNVWLIDFTRILREIHATTTHNPRVGKVGGGHR